MTRTITVFAVLVAATQVGRAAPEKAKPATTVPITTASDEARQLYLKARDLFERLRATDASALYAQAVAKDPEFALGYLGVANTSGNNKDFRAALDRAIALAPKVTPGEQLLIRQAEAGANGDVVGQRQQLQKLVKMFPADVRVHTLFGNYYFGRQDYSLAIKQYEAAIKIDPSFTQPYNQLGYAYRFTSKPADAERVFKKYTELLPRDPNPHDSYAELLMELGRFEESIKSYERALSVDPNFVASYVGIGNDQIFLGRGEAARATFQKLYQVARTDGERRQAIFWTSVSYIHESAWDKVLAEVDKLMAISNKGKDLLTVSQDHNYAANVLLEAGRPDEAAARFKTELETVAKAEVPAEVKQQTQRNALYDEGRVALAKKDIATARAKAREYGKQVALKQIPFEQRQQHELLGMIAIADKKFGVATAELTKANQRDPRVLYYLAVAYEGAGNIKKARVTATKAADFNGLAANLGYVRAKAKAMLARLK